MDPHEKLILHEWAHGRAGAGQRLSRRAWLVLQDAERVNPIKVGQAWGKAAEAQAWVARFRAMGLAGLMDAPRAGRPATTSEAIAPVVQKLGTGDDLEEVRQLVQGLDRSGKEAIWRANRKAGMTIERGHRTLDLEVPVPSSLRDLAGVFISDGFIVLAALERSDQVMDQCRGTWLSVPRNLPGPSAASSSMTHDLLGALELRIEAADHGMTKASPRRSTKKISSRERTTTFLLERFGENLKRIGESHHSKLCVLALTDLNAGATFIHFLEICRKECFWTPKQGRYPSAFKWMSPLTFLRFPARAVQMAMVRLFPEASGEPLGDLLDGIRRPRKSPFCWVRAPDLDEESANSAWLSSEEPGEHR